MCVCVIRQKDWSKRKKWDEEDGEERETRTDVVQVCHWPRDHKR